MSELYDSVDCNNLKFEYIVPAKNVSFYEYMDSEELFNKLKDKYISFSDAQKKQEDFLKKLNEVKTGGKNDEQKKRINNLNKFYHSRKEVLNFFKDYTKMVFDASHEAKQNETTETGLKILTPKQML